MTERLEKLTKSEIVVVSVTFGSSYNIMEKI